MSYNLIGGMKKMKRTVAVVLFIFAPFLVLVSQSFSSEVTAGKPITIAHTNWNESFPKAAYDPNTKRFLIAWLQSDEVHQAYIKGRMFNDSFLSPVHMFAQMHYGNDFLFTFDSLRKWYLLLWETGSDLESANVVRISEAGTVLLRAPVPTVEKPPFLEAMAFHPLNQEYLVALPLFRLTSDGEKVGGEVDKDRANSSILIPDNQTPNYFMFFRNPYNLVMQKVARDGKPLNSPHKILLYATSETSVVFNPDARQFLIAYYDVPGESLKVFRVNESGLRVDTPRVISSGYSGVYSYLQRFNGGYLLAFRSHDRIVIQRLNDAGLPVGPPTPITPTIYHSIDQFTITQGDGNHFLLVWSGDGGLSLANVYAESFWLN